MFSAPGQSAVFLIGSSSLTTAPAAVLLRSGDCLVMQGPARQRNTADR